MVEKLESPEMNLLVSAHRIIESLLAAGEGGRVKNDEIKGFITILQVVKGVSLNRANLQIVEFGIMRGGGNSLA